MPTEVISSIKGSVIPFATPALVAAIYDGVGEIQEITDQKSFLLYIKILKNKSLIYCPISEPMTPE
jgi:hypothetical protein